MLSKKDVYNAKIKNIDVEILNTTDLAIYASLNAKINVVKGEATILQIYPLLLISQLLKIKYLMLIL